ncbi:MAG: hypothetical protein H0W01_09015, partial [Pseudonocardiales bacterium]|nr:hypothetical protein [Pseudonocardiales bacterium]
MTTDQGVLEHPNAAAPGVHQLAEGTELIGEYQGSGFKEPKYLVRRSDGQVMQLPHLLYRVAESLDGSRDDEQVASRFSAETGQELTAEEISFLVEERLRPVGIVAAPDGGETSNPVKSDLLLALRYRVGVVPARIVWRIAGVFRPFFWPAIVVAALVGFVALDVLIIARGDVLGQLVSSAEALIYQPALTLAVIALTLLGGMFHECGHAAACRYGGARPGNMGIGLYIVWPALYTTVTDAYRLDRRGRLRTDLGGVYFNAIFIAGLSLVYLQTGSAWLLLVIVLLHVGTAWQFLPSIRLDGYYILADLVGVPDLFSYLGPVLKSAIPGRPTHPRVRELKPWSRRIIVLWVALVIPTLAFYLVVFLLLAPRILPVVWDGVLELLTAVDAAARAGEVATTTLGVFQLVLLLLPWLGTVLITAMIGGMLRRHAVARWGRGRVRAGTWSSVRLYAAWAAVGGLAVALVARVAHVAATLPPSAGETRLSDSAFGVLTLGWDSAPSVGVGELAFRAQLAGYAQLTGAFDRHGDVLAGARELAVLACAVLLGCLLVLAATRRLRPITVAIPLVAAAAMGPAVAALGTLAPALVGVAWMALGAVALRLGGRRPVVVVFAVVAFAAGLATAPLLLVPLAVGAGVMIVRGELFAGRPRSWRLIAVAAAALVAVLALGVTTGGGVTVLDGPERDVLLFVAILVVAGGLAVRRLRSAGFAAASVALVAALPSSAAALPLLVVAVVLLAVFLIDALLSAPVAQRPHPLLRASLAVPCFVVAVVGAMLLPAAIPSSQPLAGFALAPSSPPLAAPSSPLLAAPAAPGAGTPGSGAPP